MAMLAQERDEFRALSILVINAMASRFRALRAFAARLGYALRHADLAGSDLIRFSEPIAQVLADLGDELKHLMHTAALATDSSQGVEMLSLFESFELGRRVSDVGVKKASALNVDAVEFVPRDHTVAGVNGHTDDGAMASVVLGGCSKDVAPPVRSVVPTNLFDASHVRLDESVEGAFRFVQMQAMNIVHACSVKVDKILAIGDILGSDVSGSQAESEPGTNINVLSDVPKTPESSDIGTKDSQTDAFEGLQFAICRTRTLIESLRYCDASKFEWLISPDGDDGCLCEPSINDMSLVDDALRQDSDWKNNAPVVVTCEVDMGPDANDKMFILLLKMPREDDSFFTLARVCDAFCRNFLGIKIVRSMILDNRQRWSDWQGPDAVPFLYSADSANAQAHEEDSSTLFAQRRK